MKTDWLLQYYIILNIRTFIMIQWRGRIKILCKYLAPANVLLIKKKKFKNPCSNTVLYKQKWHLFALSRPTSSDIKSWAQPGQESGELSRTCSNSLNEQVRVMHPLVSFHTLLQKQGKDGTRSAKAGNYSSLQTTFSPIAFTSCNSITSPYLIFPMAIFIHILTLCRPTKFTFYSLKHKVQETLSVLFTMVTPKV